MFDEIRINSLLRKPLLYSKYVKLSEKIQNDPRIINHLIESDKEALNHLSNQVIIEYIMKNPSSIEYLNQRTINNIFPLLDLNKIEITPAVFGLLFDENLKKLFNHNYQKFIILAMEYSIDYIKELLFANRVNKDYYMGKYYPKLTNEQIKFLILELKDKIVQLLVGGSLNQVSYLESFIHELPVEEQLKMYAYSDKMMDHLSKEAQDIIKYDLITDNYYQAGDDYMIFMEKYPHLISLFSKDVVKKTASYIGTDYSYGTEMYLKKHYKEYTIKDILLMPRFNNYDYILKLMDFESIYQIAASKFNHIFDLFDDYHNGKKPRFYEFVNYLSQKINNKEIMDAYNRLLKKQHVPYKNNEPYLLYSKEYQALKILVNEKIIRNNDPKDIIEYMTTFDRDLLIKLLIKAYGEHVKKIMDERPYLDNHLLSSFDIFDKKIMDNLGPSFVDYFLSYNFEDFYPLVYYCLKDDKLLEVFSNYYHFYKNNIPDFGLNDLSAILERFLLIKNVCYEIDFNNMSDELKEILLLVYKDDKTCVTYIKDYDYLINYLENRKNVLKYKYDDCEKTADKRNVIFSLLTGRNVAEECYFLEDLNLENIIRIYNIEAIIQDNTLSQKMGLNRDEEALLLLLNELYRCKSDLLDRLFEYFTKESKLNPTMFQETFGKIQNYYTNLIKDGLSDLDSYETKKVINKA